MTQDGIPGLVILRQKHEDKMEHVSFLGFRSHHAFKVMDAS